MFNRSAESRHGRTRCSPVVQRPAGLLVIPLLAGLLATLGCSARQADPPSTAQFDTLSSGRVVVINTGQSIWSSRTAWRFEEDLRLGTSAADGPKVEQFGDITAVTSDSRGRIYVLDYQSQEISVFEPDGTFSRKIGRRGWGPGEFDGASELMMASGDTLWVLDDGVMRYSAFSPDGTFLVGYARSIVGSTSWLTPTFLSGGGCLDWAISFPDGRFGARVEYRPIRYGPGFGRADTFPALEYRKPMLPAGRWPVLYFGGALVGAVDREGSLWFAHSRQYRIYRRTLEGDTSLVASLPADGPPVTEADRAYVAEALARSALRDEELEALPDAKPIVHGIVPDGAGHLFVFVDVAGVPAGTAVDVFRTSGAYLGRMTLPAPVTIGIPQTSPVVHVTHDHLFVVAHDTLDVPYVSRLKIVKGR